MENPMKTISRAVLACSLAALPLAAVAHPLHGAGAGFAAGIAHPFLGLDHLLAMVAVGLWAAQISARARWIVPLAFVGTMLLGGALGLAGVSLPYVEPLTAASVLVLGFLISSGWKTSVVPGAMLAAIFAIFHGLAHAAELPFAASAITYVLGFVVATATLHALGIGTSVLLQGKARMAGAPIALAGCWLLVQAIA
jgi:urease accessory protein